MIENEKVLRLLEKLNIYLNGYEKTITKDMVDNCMSAGVDEFTACLILLEEFLNIDDDYTRRILERSLRIEDTKEYSSNPYYRNIKMPDKKCGKWHIKRSVLEPYEAFVRDDFEYTDETGFIPRIGMFSERFKYPAVYEDDRLWMSVTPNEVNTMKKPLENAKGNILVVGLGLGYFPYMASLKENVSSITIVELDRNAIHLFEKEILPQFENASKISIINEDIYEYLSGIEKLEYDYCFIDIWHDVSDGLPHYEKLKNLREKYSGTIFDFWIEETIKAYM